MTKGQHDARITKAGHRLCDAARAFAKVAPERNRGFSKKAALAWEKLADAANAWSDVAGEEFAK